MSTTDGHFRLYLLTVREVSDSLRVSPKTVRRMVDRGELRAFRVGGQLRIDRASVAQMLHVGQVRR